MTRRKLLLYLGGLTGAALVAPSLVYHISPNTKKYAAGVIQKHLSYLNLDLQGVSQYVDDYFGNFSSQALKFKVKWKSYYFLNPSVEKSAVLTHLVTNYLLSTDFFLNKRDLTKQVKYMGMYNPYTSPMPNPYSYIYYS